MMLFQSELGLNVLDLLDRSAISGRWAPLQKQETKMIGEAHCRSHRWHQTDDIFSIGIGLERVGFAGEIRCLWTLDSFAKTRNKNDRRGLARCFFDA